MPLLDTTREQFRSPKLAIGYLYWSHYHKSHIDNKILHTIFVALGHPLELNGQMQKSLIHSLGKNSTCYLPGSFMPIG